MCHVVYGSGAGLVPLRTRNFRAVSWSLGFLAVFGEDSKKIRPRRVRRGRCFPGSFSASGCLWAGPSRCPSEDGPPGTLLLIPPGIRTWASDLVPSLSLKSLSSLSPQGVPAPVKRRDAAGGNTHAPMARIEKRAVGGRKVVGSERERPLMASAALPFDGNADEVSVFCPTSVIVFDVFDAQQVLEHEPGVAGAFADAAIGDGGLGGRDTQ